MIAILGNKYGYRPFPAHIEAGEFQKLAEQIAIEGNPDLYDSKDSNFVLIYFRELLQQWYLLDSNNIPPRFVLRPIQELLPQYRAPDVSIT